MRKRILMWLFGTDDIKSYFELLVTAKRYCEGHLKALRDLVKEIESHKESLNLMMKLIKICEDHGIDVDEEIKHITLED
jgi:hypothetical protein